MKVTNYDFLWGLSSPISFLFISDLHSSDFRPVLEKIKEINPSYILLGGDILNNQNDYYSGLEFLKIIGKEYIVFMSIGNHEKKFFYDCTEMIRETGVNVLDDEYINIGEIRIGGLTSGYMYGEEQGHFKKTPKPNTNFLDSFCDNKEKKILLSHHPEYYDNYLKNHNIDLVLSGHAHGGQWQFFGHGLFAPGQGILPKYTHGIIDGRFIISRGAGDSNPFPRINNEREIIYIRVK